MSHFCFLYLIFRFDADFSIFQSQIVPSFYDLTCTHKHQWSMTWFLGKKEFTDENFKFIEWSPRVYSSKGGSYDAFSIIRLLCDIMDINQSIVCSRSFYTTVIAIPLTTESIRTKVIYFNNFQNILTEYTEHDCADCTAHIMRKIIIYTNWTYSIEEELINFISVKFICSTDIL